MRLKFLCLFVVVVLSCGEASKIDFPWSRHRTWILDRTALKDPLPGYYVLPVDRTAFTVDYPLWLEHFHVSKIYLYDPDKEIISTDVNVNYKIVEIYTSYEKTIFEGEAVLNSTVEARVNTTRLNKGVLLKPGYNYEIRLEIPEDKQLMYNEFLEIDEFKIRRIWDKYIHVRFYQVNPPTKPPNEGDNRRKLSRGMIKRFHFKYLWF